MLIKFVVKLESSEPGYDGSLKHERDRERGKERRSHVTFPMRERERGESGKERRSHVLSVGTFIVGMNSIFNE